MATVINNPSGESSGSGPITAIIIGIVVLAAIALIIFYAIPMIQNSFQQAGNGGIDINVKMPENGDQTPAPTQ